MSIFENTEYLNPKYSHFEKYVNIMFKGFWTPAKYEKLIKEQDVPFYFNEMSETSREAVRRCILAVAIVEDKVKSFWNVAFLDFPQTIVSDVSGVFANSEVIHRRAYHSLVENLKINLSEINDHPALAGRLNYLTKHLEKDSRLIGRRHVLKKIVLFTSLVERISLFTQFYILMSFSRKKKQLNTIASLQQSTAKEEIVHYSFGLDLINTIKKEDPKLWNDYLQESVEKNLLAAHKAETELISWIFEKGVPDHLTKEEVSNLLNYNFIQVNKDLDLGLHFEFSQDLYDNKSKWFFEEILNTIEPDFFDNAVGGYSSELQDVSVDDFEF